MTILSMLGVLGLILGLANVRAKLLIWVVAMGLLTALYVDLEPVLAEAWDFPRAGDPFPPARLQGCRR